MLQVDLDTWAKMRKKYFEMIDWRCTLICDTLGHTKLILWMTDSQQKKMDFFLFFYKKNLISLKNGASEEATIFFPKN